MPREKGENKGKLTERRKRKGKGQKGTRVKRVGEDDASKGNYGEVIKDRML